MSEKQQHYKVRALGNQGRKETGPDTPPTWVRRVSLHYHPANIKKGQWPHGETVISAIVYETGEIGIDPTDSHGFKNTYANGDSSWLYYTDQKGKVNKLSTGVPRAVLMEFFLLLFEGQAIVDKLKNGEEYISENYYSSFELQPKIKNP